MDAAAVISNLVNFGAAGAVIFVVMQMLKFIKDRDSAFLANLDRSQTLNLEEQRASRAQVTQQFEQIRALFDRVMGNIQDLTAAVIGLKNATVANEVAVKSAAATSQGVIASVELLHRDVVTIQKEIDDLRRLYGHPAPSRKPSHRPEGNP
jgi:hypothetical protein